MFSNAQNLLIQNTAINNAGRDIIIINNQTVFSRFAWVKLSDDLDGLSQSSNILPRIVNPRIFHPDFIFASQAQFRDAEVTSILPNGCSISVSSDEITLIWYWCLHGECI